MRYDATDGDQGRIGAQMVIMKRIRDKVRGGGVIARRRLDVLLMAYRCYDGSFLLQKFELFFLLLP